MTGLPLVRVWSIDLADPRWLRLNRDTWLDPQERARAEGFVRKDDASRFVASHLAMRWILARECGCRPDAIVYHKNAWGKPRLPKGPEFSLTHSADRAVLALSEQPVGVDIEFGMGSMSTACFSSVWSPAEKKRLGGTSLSYAHLLAIWRRKEAVVKALGRGLFQPLQDVVVPLEKFIGPDGRWSLVQTHDRMYTFHCQDVWLKGHVACIASTTRSTAEVQVTTSPFS